MKLINWIFYKKVEKEDLNKDELLKIIAELECKVESLEQLTHHINNSYSERCRREAFIEKQRMIECYRRKDIWNMYNFPLC